MLGPVLSLARRALEYGVCSILHHRASDENTELKVYREPIGSFVYVRCKFFTPTSCHLSLGRKY